MAADYRGMFMAKLEAAGVSAAIHPTDPERVILFPASSVTEDLRADLRELRPEVCEWIRDGVGTPPDPGADGGERP